MSMNQGKLEAIKQEMARVNTNILKISELKWMGMGEFNSDDHYIYCCRQESLRRNGVAFIVNKSPKWSTWVQSQKWRNDLGSFPRQTIQYHNNLRLHPSHWWWRSWSRMVLWRPTRSSRTNTKERCPFYHRGLECKSRKWRDTWQVWYWSTKWSRAKANRVLPREHTGHSKRSLATTEETALHTDITKWSILKSDWWYCL